jgi:hypothetical protein
MVCCDRSGSSKMTGRPVTELKMKKGVAKEAALPVNKVTWQQVGHVIEPGRYMFRFGWLTITSDDLLIWAEYPDAVFTLVQSSTPPPEVEAESAEAQFVETDEFHLGAFELHANGAFQEQHAA